MSYFRPKSNRGAAWGPKRRAKIVHKWAVLGKEKFTWRKGFHFAGLPALSGFQNLLFMRSTN
jgi:hypothetical protein